jgi:hypothetical protein
MQATISIPQHWGYPRFALDQRTQQSNSQFAIRNSQLFLRELQEINYPISRPSKRLSLSLLPPPCLKSNGIFIYLEVLNCELRIANCFGWRYALMPNKNSDELFHFQENQIQLFSPQELFSQIRAEIDFYQQQIGIRQQQLLAITEGRING